MKREGLTITMIFLAESANYGEGIGNISSLKKMTRGNHEQYSYISRQAMRYNIGSSLIGIQLRWMEKAELYSLHHLQLLKITPKLICLDT